MNPTLELLLIGGSALLASTLAAVTGFGGAAILLPVLAAHYGVRDAIPILTLAQLIGNGSRVWFNRSEINYSIIRWFSLGAIPLALIGGFYFSQAPIPLLQKLIGLFLVGSVIWRNLRRKAPQAIPSLQSFALIGAGFSFLSALIGSVGPIMAPFFLAYGLTKAAYIGTEALATVIIHSVKLVAYGGMSLLTYKTLLVGAALGPLMVLGSLLGKRLLDRIPERYFVWIVEGILFFAGGKFLFSS